MTAREKHLCSQSALQSARALDEQLRTLEVCNTNPFSGNAKDARARLRDVVAMIDYLVALAEKER